VIEPNPVIRGSVYQSKEMDLSKAAEDLFSMSINTSVVSIPDLFGGKIVAALDRQHPRDLFDVKLLLENEGLTNEIKKSFVVYLASHPRPLDEVIQPSLIDMKNTFESEFYGMSNIPFSYEDFLKTRTDLILLINESLTKSEKSFLISLQEGSPDWD
jgi:predicted nucleotidyltransferase component of viral defense system